MLRSRLRSSGFRLALYFLLYVLAAVVIAGTAAFFVIQEELSQRHERMVDREYTVLSNIYSRSGEDDLIETLGVLTQSSRRADYVYSLSDPDGGQVIGNIRPPSESQSTGEVDSQELGLDRDFRYFLKTGKVGEYTLTVGSSAEDISEVEEVFLQGAGWAFLVLLAISLAGGVLLSSRMNSRIQEIQIAMLKVADGDFQTKVPLTGSGDDVDRIAALINTTVEKLGTVVEINRRITTDIAHDLKTPLNRLKISVEKAMESHLRGQANDDELSEIEKDCRVIISTFDALQRISQIEAGARRSRFRSTDIGKVLSNVVEFYSTHAEVAGGHIEVEIEPGIPSVRGDDELLTQLFVNLIENCLKHAGGAPNIKCRVRHANGFVTANLDDNGPGIPERERENVFRSMYRLEKSRTKPGAGLGLSLVKAICDLHEAKITLNESDSGGLLVSIWLPV